MLQLPENFETYGEARKNGFLKMKDLKEKGTKIVGCYCTFVPTELVEAAGGTVVSLCATSEEPIPAAEANLPRNLCPLIKFKKKTGREVKTHSFGRYAGALGAALSAAKKKQCDD